MRQVAKKLGAALSKELQVLDISQSSWVNPLTQAGMPLHIAEIFAEMYAPDGGQDGPAWRSHGSRHHADRKRHPRSGQGLSYRLVRDELAAMAHARTSER